MEKQFKIIYEIATDINKTSDKIKSLSQELIELSNHENKDYALKMMLVNFEYLQVLLKMIGDSEYALLGNLCMCGKPKQD